jgi:hypothetical protein
VAFCTYCGSDMSDAATACPKCGHPRGGASARTAGGRRTEGSAVASLVLGIAGFVVCPLICSVIAVVLGNQAKTKIAIDPSLDGEGMAKAGVILGWIGIGLSALAIVGFVLLAIYGTTTSSEFDFDAIGLVR